MRLTSPSRRRNASLAISFHIEYHQYVHMLFVHYFHPLQTWGRVDITPGDDDLGELLHYSSPPIGPWGLPPQKETPQQDPVALLAGLPQCITCSVVVQKWFRCPLFETSGSPDLPYLNTSPPPMNECFAQYGPSLIYDPFRWKRSRIHV